MTKIVCVLRTGGEYRPEHVRALARQVPGLVCISDVEVESVPCIPMPEHWPGWWSKMNLFHPSIRGDLLYIDLDTVIVGDLSDLASLGRTTMLSDFYYHERPASGLMYLTESDRSKVWAAWTADPKEAMRKCMRHGDQQFIGEVLHDAQRFQDVLPGRVVSYKVHVAKGLNKRSIGDGTVPVGASVVCFHGRPRPWGIREDWVPEYDQQ